MVKIAARLYRATRKMDTADVVHQNSSVMKVKEIVINKAIARQEQGTTPTKLIQY